MIGANGLRLVDDPTIRAGLLEYYQTLQPLFEEFTGMAIDLRLQARRELAEHGEFTEGRLSLDSSWAEVSEDNLLRHDLTFSTTMMTVAVQQWIPVLQGQVAALLELLETYTS